MFLIGLELLFILTFIAHNDSNFFSKKILKQVKMLEK